MSSTSAPTSSQHSRTAATAGSSSWFTKPPGRHHRPRPGSIARRPRTMPPSASTTTAAATFGSRHRTKSSFGHASSSRPSMILVTSGAPHWTQKCPTGVDCTRSLRGRIHSRRLRPIVRTLSLVGPRKGSSVRTIATRVEERRRRLRPLPAPAWRDVVLARDPSCRRPAPGCARPAWPRTEPGRRDRSAA